jgi:hypothetical protein
MRARVSFLRQLPLTIGYTLPFEMFAVANKHSASRKANQAVWAVSSASVKAGLFCNRSLISLYRPSSSCSERCNSFAEHTLKSYCVFESLHSSATALDVQKATPSHTTANMRIDVDPLVQTVREGSVNSDNCYVNGSRLAATAFQNRPAASGGAVRATMASDARATLSYIRVPRGGRVVLEPQYRLAFELKRSSDSPAMAFL